MTRCAHVVGAENRFFRVLHRFDSRFRAMRSVRISGNAIFMDDEFRAATLDGIAARLDLIRSAPRRTKGECGLG